MYKRDSVSVQTPHVLSPLHSPLQPVFDASALIVILGVLYVTGL